MVSSCSGARCEDLSEVHDAHPLSRTGQQPAEMHQARGVGCRQDIGIRSSSMAEILSLPIATEVSSVLDGEGAAKAAALVGLRAGPPASGGRPPGQQALRPVADLRAGRSGTSDGTRPVREAWHRGR